MDSLKLIEELSSAYQLRPHYKLAAWQNSVKLVKHIYLISRSFPNEEQFGITSQVRRAVVSASLNIAEGAGRSSQKEKARFFNIADASLSEVETCLILALELDMMNKNEFISALELSRAVSAPLAGLMKRFKEQKQV